ncbi:MAG: hypothetical protein JO097_16085 [Acidobacteriaceae bacterium]|nr:hypothetical protein [Acidobacteriaceae bacterium]
MLSKSYKKLKALGAADLKSVAVGQTLLAMMQQGWDFLWNECRARTMRSDVAGKEYIAFAHGERVSRPINSRLYANAPSALALAEQFVKSPTSLAATEATGAAYTIALSVLAANDVHGVGRKASANFFEVLIGHMVAAAIGVNPRTKVKMPEDPKVLLPTDYVFDIGPNAPKIHLPIKTSTRERAVQAWVHQLVLERIFGADVYRGMLVVIGETKRDTRTDAVIEICIPNQLRLFQSRIVKLDRLYYLDPPAPYLALSTARPTPVDVRPFGDFFAELKRLIAP